MNTSLHTSGNSLNDSGRHSYSIILLQSRFYMKCATHTIHLVPRTWQTTPLIIQQFDCCPAELPEHFTAGFLWGKLPNLGCRVMNFPVPWHFSKTINITQMSSLSKQCNCFHATLQGRLGKVRSAKLLPRSTQHNHNSATIIFYS